ncbi:hypothetical protein G7067_05715 [Leucobacter insecticola]|uniref:Tat pathway signal sequence domain protein n=1 Tax=Leucobacter insecticola TaxID=2714934 RepID=A0A6G8FHQ4_9MICO|nr:hypothetical protein [Leucobacter insecticola]QIM16026.1 hypothetical protein G7067_05715 [Leucobacter insecticola]
MKTKRRKSAVVAVGACISLALALTPSIAQATSSSPDVEDELETILPELQEEPPDQSEEGPVESNGATVGEIEIVMLAADGTWVPAADPVEAPASSDISPYLLDLYQWNQCYSFNNSNFVIREFQYRGEFDWYKASFTFGNSSMGYKHISETHGEHWSKVFDNAKAQGWIPSTYAMSSWDDLMWLSANNALTGFEMNYSNVSQKACGSVTLGLYNTKTNKIVYSFRSEAVVSMNNKRLITAFPSRRQNCNT